MQRFKPAGHSLGGPAFARIGPLRESDYHYS
jgi:hypothetical protein